MVSSISLGNFFQSNGRTVAGGVGGSGLNTESLIKSLVDAKAIPKTKIETRIESNNGRLSAFAELKTLLSTFKDASNFLRNPSGVANEVDNVFEYRTAALASSTSTAASTYLTVNAEPGASVQTYSITDITSVARAKKQTTNTFTIANADTSIVTAGVTAGFFKAGTFTVNGESITLDSGDSLNAVVSKFNAVSEDTGIEASVLQVSTGNYKIVFSATETGTANNFDLDNSELVTVVDAGGSLANVTFANAQTATDAVFVIDSVTITRSTNAISDVVDGITLNLLQATVPSSTTITIDVEADESIAKSGVINFINAYNDLRVFLAKQSETDPQTGKYVKTAVLANDPVFRSIVSTVGNEVSNTVSGITAGNYDSLSDIGITFDDAPETDSNPFTRNILNVDETVLENALSSHFEDVQALFGFTYTSNNSNFRVFSHTNALTATSFTLSSNPGTETFTATVGATTITLTGTELASGGWKLTAPDGSALEGMSMLYASSATATVSVTATQGIADRTYNLLEAALTSDTGTLAEQETSIKDSTTRYNNEITRINAQLDSYRESLLKQFGALESLLSSINTLLNSLDISNKTRFADS